MRNGDLSNKVAPRVYVVFEGCVGSLRSGSTEEWDNLTSARKVDWVKAMKCWDINTPVAQKINFLAWTKDINFTVVSWLHPDAFYGIDYLMSEFGIYAGIIMSTPDELAREISSRNDVLCVYDPVPEHILKFGSKGFVISSPNDLGKML